MKSAFQYIKKPRRFFRDKANRVYMLYREQLFEIGDNPAFRGLMIMKET